MTDVEASSHWYQRLLGCPAARRSEVWLRDPDGYTVVLASDGEAA